MCRRGRSRVRFVRTSRAAGFCVSSAGVSTDAMLLLAIARAWRVFRVLRQQTRRVGFMQIFPDIQADGVNHRQSLLGRGPRTLTTAHVRAIRRSRCPCSPSCITQRSFSTWFLSLPSSKSLRHVFFTTVVVPKIHRVERFQCENPIARAAVHVSQSFPAAQLRSFSLQLRPERP